MRQAPCSECYHESLTLVLLEGAQLIEQVGECTLLPTVQVDTLTSAPALGVLFPHLLGMSNANFHGLLKSLKARTSARHIAELLLPDIVLQTDLPRDAVKGSGANCHQVRLDVAYGNDIEALL